MEITNILTISGIIIGLFILIGLIMARLFKRATRETSLVKTGSGGKKVIMDGGTIVIPFLHEIAKVNMKTLRLEVSRINDQSLITKDRMRVDVGVEFYVSVNATDDGISRAAQTLGDRTFHVDQLREMIKDQIGGQFKQLSATRVKRLVLDALDELHKFDVPSQLVEQEFKGIWDRVMHDIEHHGRSFEDEGTTEEKARAEYTAIAERRVRLGLVIAEIGNANDVQVTEEEHQQALIAEVQKYPGQEQQVYDYFRNNQQALAGLRAPIFEDKVVNYVVELADVEDKTVTKEELVKLVEESEEEDLEPHNHD